MFGAVYGDIIGSYYEVHATKQMDFPLFVPQSTFTDDTVMTAAVCETLLAGRRPASGFLERRHRAREYACRYRQYYARYPSAGFGEMFRAWAEKPELTRQRSYGNGAAMRVIPIAYACSTLEEVLREARLSSLFTHCHPEAVAGAQAVAAAAFLALQGTSKENIRQELEKRFGYALGRPLTEIRTDFAFDSRTARTVPPAIRAFLEAEDYEEAVRLAVSLGGDADTMACIAGGIAEAYFHIIPEPIRIRGDRLLDSGLKTTLRAFQKHFAADGNYLPYK